MPLRRLQAALGAAIDSLARHRSRLRAGGDATDGLLAVALAELASVAGRGVLALGQLRR